MSSKQPVVYRLAWDAWLLASFSQIVYVALHTILLLLFVLDRALGTSENQGGGGLSNCNLLLLVEIGFTDLPKSGDVMAPPEVPATPGSDRPGCRYCARLS